MNHASSHNIPNHDVPDSVKEKDKLRLPIAGILAVLALAVCLVVIIVFRDNQKIEQEVLDDVSGKNNMEQLSEMMEAMEEMDEWE